MSLIASLFRAIFPRRRRLDEVIFETKKICVDGVEFKIRKVNPLDYVRGAKVYRQFFETYRTASVEKQNEMLDTQLEAKVKDHFRDVFMTTIQYPKLCYEKDKDKPESAGAIVVDHLFTDWEFAQDLYAAIVAHSFGKKKPTSSSSPSRE